MKVTVSGTDVRPERISEVLLELEREYELRIHDLTMYIRFVNDKGYVVEPKLPVNACGLAISLQAVD